MGYLLEGICYIRYIKIKIEFVELGINGIFVCCVSYLRFSIFLLKIYKIQYVVFSIIYGILCFVIDILNGVCWDGYKDLYFVKYIK